MLSINTNLSSLIVQSNLLNSTLGLNQTIERMTTGFKINGAKDNAAGYSILTDLNTKISSMLQVQQNTADGISLLQTAEGGLSEIEELLTRLRALAVQASNGTYDELSRDALQSEADSIIEQIEQITDSIEYDGNNLYASSHSQSVYKRALNINEQLSANLSSRTLSLSASVPSGISADGTIQDAVDFRGYEQKVVTIDGVSYTVQNRSGTSNTLSYVKDSSTGELTFLGSNFIIRGQDDVEHNIVISGQYNTVYGGNLNDSIKILDTTSIDNSIYGGDGDDNIVVNSSYCYIYGQAGNDTITIYKAARSIYGGEGDDTFNCEFTGGLTIYGEGGDDVFNINGVNSGYFYGGDGEDTFNVNSGSKNTVDGGSGTNAINDKGSDTIKVNVPGATSFSVEFKGKETKTVNISGIDYTITNQKDSSESFVYTIQSDGRIDFAKGSWIIKGDVNKSHYVSLGARNTFYGGNLKDKIIVSNDATAYGLDGDDDIKVGQFANVYGGDGNDTITVTNRKNTILAGDGDDKVVFSNAVDYIYLDLGNGNDSVSGSGINKSAINGGSGTNTFSVAATNSLLSGFGENVDNAQAIVLSANETRTIKINGKNYTVTNNLQESSSLVYNYNAVTDTVEFGTAYMTITGQQNTAHKIRTFGQHIIFYGGDLDDDIIMDSYACSMYGGAGNDRIVVNADDSTAFGGDGNDELILNEISRVLGEAGDDIITINKGNSAYTHDGGLGNDTYNINAKANITDSGGNNVYNVNTNGASVSGSSGDDTFYIKGNNNTVTGAGGDDYFVIDGNNNTIDGGTGNNYYIDNGSGTNFSNVNHDPNSGTLEFTFLGEVKTFTQNGRTYTVTNNISGTNVLTFSLNPNTGVITLDGSGFQIDSENDKSAVLNIRGNNNIINGSSLSDTITVEQGSNNIVNGLSGDDILTMDSADNSLHGGDGNDTLILNSSSNQSVTGGAGDDIITVTGSSNTNVDAGAGDNRITISGSDNVVSSADGDNTITVSGIGNKVSAGDGANDYTITGSDNSLTGGSGLNSVGIQGDNNRFTLGQTAGTLHIYGDNNEVAGGAGDNAVIIKGDGNRYTSTSGNKEIEVRGNLNEVTGGSGRDTIRISGDSNIANGGASNDSFIVTGGRDNVIDGNDGNRNTLIDNGIDTIFRNVYDITPEGFNLHIKVDIGSDSSTYIDGSINFNTYGLSVDFSDSSSSLLSLSAIDDLLSDVQEQLLNIGSLVNRLESAAEYQSIRLNNLISSRSTLSDADLAKESSSYIRYQILQQASAVLLASSRNLNAQNVLGLLNNVR